MGINETHGGVFEPMTLLKIMGFISSKSADGQFEKGASWRIIFIHILFIWPSKNQDAGPRSKNEWKNESKGQ